MRMYLEECLRESQWLCMLALTTVSSFFLKSSWRWRRCCNEACDIARLRACSLPYLEACLKESLRLYPPAPTIIRMASRPMEIGGFPVRLGQWIAVAAYSMHRNPAYWQVRAAISKGFISACDTLKRSNRPSSDRPAAVCNMHGMLWIDGSF